jgi:CBS domain-containing protein
MATESEKVQDVMERNVQTADVNSTVRDCAKLMAKKKVSSVVIVDGSKAVGIVTERDLVVKVIADNLDPSKVLARDIMSTPLITIGPEATVKEAAGLMTEYRIRRLVVIDANGMLAGLVTASGLAKLVAKEHKDPIVSAIARIHATPTGGPYQ